MEPVYKHIKEFVSSLNDCYGSDSINIQLYNRLLEKTTDEHKDAIGKHIDIFKDFCTINEKNILNKDYNFVSKEIRYSDKVYLNMADIFESSGDKDVLWKYIFTISSYLNPKIEAKKLLKGDTSENNFLLDIMDKVENSIDPDSTNPMDAITNMMSSGVFSELVGSMTNGLQSGDLNLGSLMGTMNNMMGEVSQAQGNINRDVGSSKKRRNTKKKKPKRK